MVPTVWQACRYYLDRRLKGWLPPALFLPPLVFWKALVCAILALRAATAGRFLAPAFDLRLLALASTRFAVFLVSGLPAFSAGLAQLASPAALLEEAPVVWERGAFLGLSPATFPRLSPVCLSPERLSKVRSLLWASCFLPFWAGRVSCAGSYVAFALRFCARFSHGLWLLLCC